MTDWAHVRLTAARQAGLITRRQLVSAGVSEAKLRTRLSRGEVARVVRGVYSIEELAPTSMDGRRVRAAVTGLLAVAPKGIATGACALALHGVWGLPQRLTPDVALLTGARARGAAGVRVRQFSRPFPTTMIEGWRAAAPVPALVQAAPEWTLRRTVAVFDSALNREILTPGELMEVRRRLRRRAGGGRLDPCWAHIDGRAGSPAETWVRLECVRAGLPAPQLQVKIVDDRGALTARGDLGWPRSDGSWVLVEVDGREVHSAPAALYHDRARQNRIAIHGRHTLLRFTSADLGTGRIERALREALRM